MIVIRNWSRRLARLGRAVNGNAAVEFGLVAPVLMGLLIPVADLGIAFSEEIQVQQAAQAGAEYATLHPWNSNSSTAIANAVTAANNLPGLAATPAPSQTCGCPTGTNVNTVTCGITCSDGQTAGYYAIVNAQAPYSPVLPYSVLGNVTLTARSTIRIQ